METIVLFRPPSAEIKRCHCEAQHGLRVLMGNVVQFRHWACKNQDSDGEREDSPAARARQQLEALLNKTMRIRMTDGRTLVGCFLCTDRDCNVILGSAQEFLKPSDSFSAGEPRVLGLAMVPGHHIVSIEVQRESLTGPPYL
ncbi:N-alpha-acetyltransferase 38, NatC auxiliary subunit isoform X1 [Carlito syrichta]|uniref:N-alpha-acetyltransferase 38, NatC auxiliary subunit n=1 Tax=Carlito syrichta TaxID=1868482 RepID=A0A3Q0E1W2_CARSF|nr:N-alpha-acetyltransferase 38, NatC auxiliary subunit isoform X1 [Carlito syrichta]